MFMRKAISITLDETNILWLKGQAGASSKGSVSDVLDRLVTRARQQGHGDMAAVRSVAGTIDLPDDDGLDAAGAYVRSMFDRSLRRSMLVKEEAPKQRRSRRG
jgi:hypothetical protein